MRSDIENELVTIVTPVYNVSEYLDEMLQSILLQTYENWELILVDDGSTDNSGAICDAFCQGESRAKVIHQQNRGQAAARDVAIAMSRGAWLVFADSDDVVHPRYIEQMVTAARYYKVDIVECHFVEFEGPVPCLPPESGGVAETVYGMESVAQIALDCRTVVTALWGKLFRTELFSGLCCPEGQLYEDEYLIPRLYGRARSYCLLTDHLYLYRKRAGSTMTEVYDQRRALANLEIFKERLELYQGRFTSRTDGILLFRHCMSMCTILERIDVSGQRYKLDECASLCVKEIREKGSRYLRSRHMPIKRKALVAIAIVSPKAISFLRNTRKRFAR